VRRERGEASIETLVSSRRGSLRRIEAQRLESSSRLARLRRLLHEEEERKNRGFYASHKLRMRPWKSCSVTPVR